MLGGRGGTRPLPFVNALVYLGRLVELFSLRHEHYQSREKLFEFCGHGLGIWILRRGWEARLQALFERETTAFKIFEAAKQFLPFKAVSHFLY